MNFTKGQYFYLTAETGMRLRVCAALSKQSMSAIVEKALRAYLSQLEPQSETKVLIGNAKEKP